jgi:hypothetical protein
MKREIEEARRGGGSRPGERKTPSALRAPGKFLIKKKGLKAYEIDTRQRCE